MFIYLKKNFFTGMTVFVCKVLIVNPLKCVSMTKNIEC